MEMEGYVISGIKVVNIFEENAASIQKMANLIDYWILNLF